MAAALLALIPLIAGIWGSLYVRKEFLRQCAKYDRNDTEIWRRFVWHELLVFVIWCVPSVALFFVWYWLLKSAAALLLPKASPNAIIFSGNWPIWLIGALMMTCLTSCPLIFAISRLILGSRYEEYSAATFARGLHNPRGRLFLRFCWQFMLAITAFCTGLIFLGFNYYAVFEPDHIRINGFWNVRETRYTYAQVTDIAQIAKTTAPNGNVRDRPHVAIRFDSGEAWTSLDGLHDPNSARDKQLVEFIQSRTALEPTAHDFIPW